MDFSKGKEEEKKGKKKRKKGGIKEKRYELEETIFLKTKESAKNKVKIEIR